MDRILSPFKELLVTDANRHERAALLYKLAGSLGSGLISALCLTLIASQRVTTIDADVAVTLLLFIQWQVFGLTIAKLGIDQVIFAVVSRDTSIRFSSMSFLLTKALPLAIVAAVAIGIVFTPLLGLMAGVSIFIDTYSTMTTADLNARQRFGTTALANLLNYPLFFVLLLGSTLFQDHVGVHVLMFVISSLCRAYWLLDRQRRLVPNTTIVDFQGAPALAAQQSLNYVLFRGDQLMLVLVSTLSLSLTSKLTVDEYVFLGKFPELASSGLVILGFFIFPRLKMNEAFTSIQSSMRLSSRQVVLGIAISALIVAAFVVYQSPWIASNVLVDPRWLILLPFLLQTLLILPVNAITYVLLGKGHTYHLFRIQAASILLAGIVAFAAIHEGSLSLLAWVVPFQLCLFAVICVFTPVKQSSQRSHYVQ